MKFSVKIIFMLCSYFYSGFIDATEAGTTPKLEVSVTHENKDELRPGETFWYAFNISHSASSDADAKNIQITWFMPHYIHFDQLYSGNSETEVELKDDVVVFKKSSLAMGITAHAKFQVSLDNSSEVTQGHHYVVTMISSQWYSSTSVKFTKELASYSVEFVVPGCSKALGMESRDIKPHQLLASSSLPASRPDMARFNQDAWCAQLQDANQFIQVIFSKEVKITRIATKGRSLKPHWVKEYTIQFSEDNINWISYKENGFDKVFSGNSDMNSAVAHWLMYPISANYIRIRPKSWNTQICMRFELYGCQITNKDNCINPIGLENGLIPDAALSDNTGSSTSPANVRLNKKMSDFPFGWSPESYGSSDKEWVQVDLGSVHKITSTAIQGSNNEPESLFYVKSYELQFSNNTIDWVVGKKSEKDKFFKGPESGEAAKFPTPAFFPTPVYARFVRLIPEEFYSIKVLRMEIYGCVSEEGSSLSKKDDSAEFSRRSTLLDKVTNTFYVCVYKENRNGVSCRSTKDGKTWQDMNSRIVNIIGHDSTSNTLYGLDHNLSYMYTKDGGKTWKFISKKEWQRHQTESEIALSTKLNDILVGTRPGLNWTDSNGQSWGSDGVHLKSAGSAWSLIASWKCCGF